MMAVEQRTLFEVSPKPKDRPPGRRVPEALKAPEPLRTTDCATWMGVSLDYIYGLIDDGTLKAKHEKKRGKKRGIWLIQQEDFVACLKKLKWSRIPKIG